MTDPLRTRVAYTYEESAPGVPYWGPNTVTTDLIPGQTDIAIENLLPNKRYYVKTWNEDQFGNKSREIETFINTPPPTRLVLLSLSANGYLDSGSPMRAYVSIPSSVTVVREAIINLAFRQFMAPAQDAASGGTTTSNTDGAATTPSGGGSTSGASSASSSNNGSASFGLGTNPTSGTSGAASAGTAHTHSAGTYADTSAVQTDGGHSHPIPHTHTTPSHTHTTPDHSHAIAAHGHALTYGTFEETYPTSHSVSLILYKRIDDAWSLIHTTSGLTADLQAVDWTAYLTGPGDWRIEAISAAAQPNGGRLGLDLFGTLSLTVADS